MKKSKIDGFFVVFLEWIFRLVIFFLLLGVVIGVVKLFVSMKDLAFSMEVMGVYKNLILDVFTLLILIELARSFIDYFKSKRLRLTHILDTAIIFIIRDIMVLLYEKSIDTKVLNALAILLFVLGILRMSFIYLYQREQATLSKAT